MSTLLWWAGHKPHGEKPKLHILLILKWHFGVSISDASVEQICWPILSRVDISLLSLINSFWYSVFMRATKSPCVYRRCVCRLVSLPRPPNAYPLYALLVITFAYLNYHALLSWNLIQCLTLTKCASLFNYPSPLPTSTPPLCVLRIAKVESIPSPYLGNVEE